MFKTKPKITVVGAGNVGATTALFLAQKELGDIVLLDIIEGFPQGIALDILQSSPVQKWDSSIMGSNDNSEMKDSDIVVVTAGLPRKPGMDRLDLLKKNASIVKEISENIQKYTPNSIVIIVSNPIDLMVYLAYRRTGFPKHRVIGMAGVLDSARLATFLAIELGVSVKDISPMVLGGHGDSMIPLSQYSTVQGISVRELLSPEKISAINERTQKGGAEIVGLLKKGSAYYAPAASSSAMVESIVRDQNRILPCSCLLEGEYGIHGVFIGVPTKLGQKGIQEIITIPLQDSELSELQKNAKNYQASIQELKQDSQFAFL